MKYLKSIQLTIILLLGVFTYAQNLHVDSLKAVLEILVEDTSKVNTLNDMAAIVYRTNPDKAIEYSSEAKILAEQINFQKGLAVAYKNIGLRFIPPEIR